jgi:hypothetical protein
VAFPVMAYSFTAHPYYLGIYNNLAAATPARMLSVTDMVCVLGEGSTAVVASYGRMGCSVSQLCESLLLLAWLINACCKASCGHLGSMAPPC